MTEVKVHSGLINIGSILADKYPEDEDACHRLPAKT